MIYKKWFYVDFDNNKNQSSSNKEAGLYIISVRLKNGNYKAVYIGQAKNLKERFQQHLSNNEQNINLKNYLNNNYNFKFSYTEENLQINRDQMELYLYNKLKPQFNEVTPPSKIEKEINIPENIQ